MEHEDSSSDLENAIDDILQGLDDPNKSTKGAPSPEPHPPKSGPKNLHAPTPALPKTKSALSIPKFGESKNGSQQGKSVRFQFEDEDAGDSLFKKQTTSNLLNSMFMTGDSLEPEGAGSKPKPTPTGLFASSPSSSKPASKPDPSDDWLGISTEKEAKPSKESDLFLPDQAFSLPFSGEDRPSSSGAKKPLKTEAKPEKSHSAPTFRNSTPSPTESTTTTATSSMKIGAVLSTSTSQSPSFLDSLPFLLGKEKPEGGGGGGDFERAPEVPQKAAPKKKGKVVKSSAVEVEEGTRIENPPKTTLSLPTHLVSEDELKGMSASLKTLYNNQLLLQETTYQEQLNFLTEQIRRKEELFQKELARLQDDYELRLQRLNSRSKRDAYSGEDTGEASEEKVVRKVLSELQRTLNLNNIDMDVGAGAGLTGREEGMKSFMKGEIEAVKSELTRLVDDAWGKTRASLESFGGQQLSSVESSILSNLSKLLERERESERRGKEKSAQHMKDLRKDLKRLYLELDGKNDMIHRSQLNLELEQRSINQSVRDINTFLKVMTESGSFGGHSASANSQLLTSHLAAIQMQNTSTNDAEIRLLREERKSLSESLAQLNVERRKMTEERIFLEREKMELERERERLKDLEAAAKFRVQEAEEVKRRGEEARVKEMSFKRESELAVQSLERERAQLKERWFEIEQMFKLKEGKLFAQKSELLKEQELLERIKEQDLCPGCLKGKGRVGALPLTFPPRTSGDGLELDLQFGGKISQLLTQDEKTYFLNF